MPKTSDRGGTGGGGIGGTIVTGQVAYGAALNTIAGDNRVFFNPASGCFGIGVGATGTVNELDLFGLLHFNDMSERNVDFGFQLVGGNTAIAWIPFGGLNFKANTTGPAGDRNFMLNNGDFGLGVIPNEKLDVKGNIALRSAGNKFKIKEGLNAAMGVSTLVAGTITVSTTAVTTDSRILLTHQNSSGVIGNVYPTNIISGTSFDIQSDSAADTSNVLWVIIDKI